MAKKTRHVIQEPEDGPQRRRLAELDDQILSFKATGRLWDYEDEHVSAILKKRDDLFYEINTHLAGLSFHDMGDDAYEAIDKKHQAECEKEDPYEED